MSLIEVSTNRSFNGYQKIMSHLSTVLKCDMRFGIYLPEPISATEKLPVIFYLSGLTCTETNFIEKSGFQRFASQYRIIVVNPDTSPRGKSIKNDDNDTMKAGPGAGFYLDAIEPRWLQYDYKMYTYIIDEFVPLIFNNYPIIQHQCGIFGHSMGGHGAITIGLKNPNLFQSISAFAPICNPMNSPIGKQIFKSYLGENTSKWLEYDSVELAKQYNGPIRRILIDQGSADPFYINNGLQPENLIEGVNNPKIEWNFKLRKGYNHGYYYIATFIQEHFDFFIQQIHSP